LYNFICLPTKGRLCPCGGESDRALKNDGSFLVFSCTTFVSCQSVKERRPAPRPGAENFRRPPLRLPRAGASLVLRVQRYGDFANRASLFAKKKRHSLAREHIIYWTHRTE